MADETFEMTDEHILLLRSAYVGWDDCEFGAPAIDCKRPYGNSSVIEDMAELLGVEFDEDEGVNRIDAERMTQLHRETQTALQIILVTGSMVPGTYQRVGYSNNWQPVAT